VLPLDNRPFSELVFSRPTGLPSLSSYTYRPFGPMVPEHAAVNVRNRSHSITADVDVEDIAEGVMLAMGNVLGGFSFYLLEGRPAYVHNYVGLERHRIASATPVPAGRHSVAMRFTKTGEHRGTVHLLIDDRVVAEGEVPRFTPTRFSLVGAGLTCGYSAGLPPSDDYAAPFRFTGLLRTVVVDVSGSPHLDPDAEAEVAITTQ